MGFGIFFGWAFGRTEIAWRRFVAILAYSCSCCSFRRAPENQVESSVFRLVVNLASHALHRVLVGRQVDGQTRTSQERKQDIITTTQESRLPKERRYSTTFVFWKDATCST